MPARLEAIISDVWLAVIVVGAGTIVLKSFGPVVLGGRRLPAVIAGPMALLAPSLLAALVMTQTFSAGRHLVLDARAAGVGAAALAIVARAPLLVVVIVAAVATALVRLF